MTYEEALAIVERINEARERYSQISQYRAPITVSIKEETIKKLVFFKTKNYSISISSESEDFESSQINSLDDAQKIIDELNQKSVSALLSTKMIRALTTNVSALKFEEIDKEYQQMQNQYQTNINEHIVGSNISFQSFFPYMFSEVRTSADKLINGDDHENILPTFFLPPECQDAFKQICNWKFDLSAISRVENYIKEIEEESIKAISENNKVDKLIARYLKTRENTSLPQEGVLEINSALRVLSKLETTLEQAKEILQGIKDENKTDNFKRRVEPLIIAYGQAIEIARTRFKTIENMIRNASEYLMSQEYKDFLATVILEKGNEHQKKYFHICEQIAEKGGSFNFINSPSQAFMTGGALLNFPPTSIEEARLFNGKVVSVYDQTIAGLSFYPVTTAKEKENRDNLYNHYDRGADSDGNKLPVLEEHKRQAVWYSGTDGSTYLWLKGVGFINTETETLLTADEFNNLEAQGVKITITRGLNYSNEEICHPRMKDGSPYMSVYDFERNISNITSFRGKEVTPNTKEIYAILKENGLIPPYFGVQAIKYLDAKFHYTMLKEQESEVSTEEFNEFDYKQEVTDSISETENTQGLISEELDTENLEEVKEKVKGSLAEKIRKAGMRGLDSISVKKEDLDIMPEIVSITQIIAKELGIDIEVEASENVEGNVTAVANYDRNKICFNLLALRNLDSITGFDVTRLGKGDITDNAMNIIRLIQIMLHEIKHFEQKVRIDNIGIKCDMETFKEAVENEIIRTNAGAYYYQKAHDNFLSEINADIFGWEKCIECFEEYFGTAVPKKVLDRREEVLEKLGEKKQPITNSRIQGNGCLSKYLSEHGHKAYASGKLVAEQFLEIIESLEEKMTKGCDETTRLLIEKMKDNCTSIIKSSSVSC